MKSGNDNDRQPPDDDPLESVLFELLLQVNAQLIGANARLMRVNGYLLLGLSGVLLTNAGVLLAWWAK